MDMQTLNAGDSHILEKLEPQVQNSKGQIVVEVEKVFKDL